MQLNDLRPAEGSTKSRKRIGRGNSSGHGTTAGRGNKGQLSRSGGGKGAGFEGGQQPLAMRLPKLPGFINHGRVEYVPVNVEGDSMSLSLNHHYVAECLSSAPDREKILIELQSPTLPTVFKSTDKINYLYLVMPSLL